MRLNNRFQGFKVSRFQIKILGLLEILVIFLLFSCANKDKFNELGPGVDAGSMYKFINKWGADHSSYSSEVGPGHGDGTSSSKVGAYNTPIGICIVSNYVFVAEYGNHRVQKLNLEGYPSAFSAGGIQDEVYGNGLYGWDLSTTPLIPDRKTGSGFYAPYGLYANSTYIYTVDYEDINVQINNWDGSFNTEFGTVGSGNGEFLQPKYITGDKAGNIYVTDGLRNDVQKFNATGTFITNFGGEGTQQGKFIDINGIAINSRNEIFVCDTGNHRIQVFSTNGTYLRTIKKFGFRMEDLYKPVAIAIDPRNDNIVVTDGDRIKIFTREGDFVTGFGQSGRGNGEFNNPKGIYVDSRGYIYVADTGNHRIQVFAPQ